MNTIVRSSYGWVDEYKTVAATLKVLARQSGYIRIDYIREYINNQLSDPVEHLSRKMVVRSVAKLLRNPIDKYERA